MKINDFIKEKKRIIISGVAFLIILMVIAGVFSYGIDSKGKFNSLKDQIDLLSSSVSLLETSSPEIRSSIDGMDQKIDGVNQKIDRVNEKIDGMNHEFDTNTADKSVNFELQSKLDDIIKYLSELNQEIESLRIVSEAGMQPTESEEEKVTDEEVITVVDEETITVPETKIPGSPANPDNHPQTSNTIKAGQDFTITVKANEVSNLYGYQFNLNYDNQKVTYKGNLESSISEISTIFKKDMSDHLLVGATMIGNRAGYSGQNETICTMVFTAAEDIEPSIFTINGVNTVDAEQNYIENISGWSIDVKAES